MTHTLFSFSLLIHTSSTSSQHVAIPPTCPFILSLPCGRNTGLTQSIQQVHGCEVTHCFTRNCWKQDLSSSIPQLPIGLLREVRPFKPLLHQRLSTEISVLQRPCSSSYSYYELVSATTMSCPEDSVCLSIIHHPILICFLSLLLVCSPMLWMGSTRVLFKAEHSTYSQLSSLFTHLFDFFEESVAMQPRLSWILQFCLSLQGCPTSPSSEWILKASKECMFSIRI